MRPQRQPLWSARMETPLGPLLAQASPEGLLRLDFAENAPAPPAGALREENALLRRLRRELAEYFAGERRGFSIPLRPEGTDFQRRAWRALLGIPWGQTRTYLQQARMMGLENPSGACRAVGQANAANPIVILIPCHRVVSAGGRPGGYSAGPERKRRLLELEGAARLIRR